jgi:DNA-binding transcriptional ArsR family regulator
MTVLQQAGLVESRKEGRWGYYRLPGKNAPAVVRQAIAWVNASMADEPQALDDYKRLKEVMKKDLEDLCALYKS